MPDDPLLIHRYDQLNAELLNIAHALGEYRRALEKEGFSAVQVEEMVRTLERELICGGFEDDDED